MAAVLRSPPVTHAWVCEVGKSSPAGPFHPSHRTPLLVFAKSILRVPVLVEIEIHLALDARIRTGDQVNTRLFQFLGKSGQVWVTLLVNRKRAITVEVIDVEVEYAQGEIVMLEAGEDPAHLGFCPVAPLRLLVAERPAGRQWRPPG